MMHCIFILRIFKRKLFNSKSKKLTAKEKRASKIYEIPKRQTFSDFFTLHLLWEKYMIQLLDIDGAEANLVGPVLSVDWNDFYG